MTSGYPQTWITLISPTSSGHLADSEAAKWKEAALSGSSGRARVLEPAASRAGGLPGQEWPTCAHLGFPPGNAVFMVIKWAADRLQGWGMGRGNQWKRGIFSSSSTAPFLLLSWVSDFSVGSSSHNPCLWNVLPLHLLSCASKRRPSAVSISRAAQFTFAFLVRCFEPALTSQSLIDSMFCFQ